MSKPAERVFGWTPFRAAWHGAAMRVDWCHLGLRRMTEPFFYESVATAMRDPFNLAFQQRTSVEKLLDLPPGLPPAGFVFHMSRCGSTLVSQALAAFESNIVVSEAPPLRAALRALRSGRATPAQAGAWFAGLVTAFAQPRFAYEQRLIVKFMAADVLDIAAVRQIFPAVPWVVLTRDPAEIMASQAASAGVDLMRGQIAPALLGLAEDAVWAMDPIVYQAEVLAAFGRAAIDANGSGRGLIVDYADLPHAIWTQVMPHFGLAPGPAAVDLMRAVSRRHSKAPATAFVPDRDPHRKGAAPFRPIAEAIAGSAMTALAALRRPA